MARRKVPAFTPPPQSPADIEADRLYAEERQKRSWATRPVVQGQNNIRQTVENIEEGAFRIPVFQRPYVWTDEHVLHVLDSLWRGYYIGSLLLWDRYNLPADTPTIGNVTPRDTKSGYLVIDGQQRLWSLHLAFRSGRFSFDCDTEKFVIGVPPSKRVIPLHILARTMRMRDEDLDVMRWLDAGGSTYDIGRLTDELIYREITYVKLPETWPLATVMDMFRRLNTTGVRMDPEEVEAALRKSAGA